MGRFRSEGKSSRGKNAYVDDVSTFAFFAVLSAEIADFCFLEETVFVSQPGEGAIGDRLLSRKEKERQKRSGVELL